jgi:putative DNA primase/helicase
MSRAFQVAKALGGAVTREGRGWRCRCPAHGGVSLNVADGQGVLLVTCWAGCNPLDVLSEIRRLHLFSEDAADRPPIKPHAGRGDDDARRTAEIERLRRGICAARDIYRRSGPAAGTPVEAYLRSRGITGPAPPVLRWLPLCPHRNGRYFPAMVAPIVNVDGAQIAVHKTFLSPDGGKADLPKEQQREIRGPMKGGAVRLGQHRPDTDLMTGEGIESTLSAMQLFGDLPGWAALSAGGLEDLVLPPSIAAVAIAADNDLNGVGPRAALRAYERWSREGRTVRILLPSNIDTDFNDELLQGKK